MMVVGCRAAAMVVGWRRRRAITLQVFPILIDLLRLGNGISRLPFRPSKIGRRRKLRTEACARISVPA